MKNDDNSPRLAALKDRYDRVAARRERLRRKVNAHGQTILMRGEHIARRDWLDALDGK